MHRVSSALLDNSEFGRCRLIIVQQWSFFSSKSYNFDMKKYIRIISSNALETRCIFLPTYIQRVLTHRLEDDHDATLPCTMCDFHDFGLIFAEQMHCLPLRLKSTLWVPFGHPPIKKNSNNIDFSL